MTLPTSLLRIAALPLLLAACASPPTGPAELPLFIGQPAAGLRLTVVDMEGQQALVGDEVVVPKPANPKVPASAVRARRSGKDAAADAVTLQWQDAWFAVLRIEAEHPLDLRPYLAEGTLEFEVRTADLSHAGLNIAMSCGQDCTRSINHVLPSRALAGRGWQRLAFPLQCFVREGADFSAVTQPFSLETSGSGAVEVANVRLLRQGRPNAPCPDYRTQSVTPAPLAEVWSIDWWTTRHERKLDEIKALRAAGQNAEVVFIGDSITHGWEEAGRPVWERHFARYHALDLGFGGDRTENVLWRLQHGELDGIAPKVVVMMIGTNNTGHRQEDPATTAAGIRRLLDEIQQRQPQARVLLLAIFPRDQQPGTRLRRINEQVSQRIAAYADGRRVHFLNINDQLMNPDGTLSTEILPDLLHLSEQGYDRWARAIEPTLQRLLAAP